MTNETEYADFGFTRGEEFLTRKPDWNTVEVKEDSFWQRHKNELIAVLVMALIATIIFPFVPWVSHAQEITPKNDFPNTQAGVCMMIHEYGWKVSGAPSEKAVHDLCLKEGIQIN